MARTTINSQGVPVGTITASDLSYPLTDFSSTGIDDNASSNAITISSSQAVTMSGLTYPTSDGNADQVLKTNGSGTLSFVDVSSGGVEYVAKTTTYTASANEGVIANTSGGAWTLTLPASPSAGDKVFVADGDDWSTNNLTVARNGSTIEGSAADFTMDYGGVNVGFIYDGSTWQVYPQAGLLQLMGIDDNATSTALTIDSSGNVGIGETSPASLLEVSSATGTTPTSPTEIRISTSTSGSNWSTTAPWGQLSFYSADTSYGGAKVQAAVATTADAALGALSRLGFFLSPSGGSLTEYMSVTHYGNVGIGTTSPSAPLHVNVTEASTGETDPLVRFERFTSGDNAYLDITVDNSNNLIGFQSTGTSDGGFTFGGASTERMRITNTGNVGINTDDPSALLEIAKTGAGAQLLLTQAGTDQLGLLAGTQGAGIVYEDENYFAIWSQDYADRGTENNLTERMRITSAGNVGIGTTNPTSKLQVEGSVAVAPSSTGGDFLTIASGNYQTTIGGWSGTTDSDIDGLLAGSTFGNIIRGAPNGHFVVALQENDNADTFSVVSGGGNYQTDTTYDTVAFTVDARGHGSFAGNIALGANGTSTGTEGGELGLRSNDGSTNACVLDVAGSNNRLFTTTNNQNTLIGQLGSATGGYVALYTQGGERVRVDPDGFLLVGTTSRIASSTNTTTCTTLGINYAWFAHNDAVYIQRPNATAGNVLAFYRGSNYCGSVSISSSNTTSFNTSSDERLKENIVDAPAGNIDDIRVRSFDWKSNGAHQTYGMVAQELVDVAPEAVTQGNTKDTMWEVDYSKLVPMMIKEIQDLKAEVAALKGA